MKIRKLYIVLSTLTILILVSGIVYIYVDGQKSINVETSAGLERLEENLAFSEFISKYKDFVHNDIENDSTLNSIYDQYLLSSKAVESVRDHIPEIDFSELSQSIYQIKLVHQKKIKNLKSVNQAELVIQAKWKLIESQIGDEIVLRLDKRQEFMPGFKQTLSLWGRDIPLFEKIKNNIDVSYVDKDKFNEIQSLFSLSHKLIELDQKRSVSLSELRKRSNDFYIMLSNVELNNNVKILLEELAIEYVVAIEKWVKLKQQQSVLRNSLKTAVTQSDSILNEILMPAWHSYMSGFNDQKLTNKNQRHQLVLMFMVVTSIFVIVVLLVVFLNIFPFLTLLEKKAKEISSGVFDSHFPKIPNNEIGNVMVAFNEMSQQITSYINKLKVEETNKLQLTDSLQKFKRLNEMSEFSAKMAHEIKNPISILNFCLSDAVESFESSDFQRSLVEVQKAQKALERLKGLTHRLGAKSVSVATEKLSLGHTVNDLLQMYRSWLGNEKITLTTEFPDRDVYLEAPRLELQSAISNLVDNSIESLRSNSGKFTAQIFVKIIVDKEHIRLIIANPGERIAQPEMIFNNFYTTKNGEQRGLGLAIVKDFVQMMGGELKYEFENGLNSFTMLIPVNQPH
jgi:signal transduction histidine kinase